MTIQGLFTVHNSTATRGETLQQVSQFFKDYSQEG